MELGLAVAISLLAVLVTLCLGKRTRLAEIRLRSSELRYRSFFENNPLPSWIYDRETLRFLDVNQTAIDRYGYSRAEFLEMSVSRIRFPQEHATIERDLSTESGSQKRSGPWRHRLKNGNQIIVELITRQVDWFGKPARLVMAHDISDKIASEDKFRCLFNRSADAILLTGDGVVIDCNQAAVTMLKATGKNQIIGLTPVHLLAERQRDGTPGDVLAASMRDETDRVGGMRKDLLHRRMNGEEFLVDLSMTAVEVGGKKMRLVIWHDLTERERAQDAVRKSELRLRDAQAISQLGTWELDLATGTLEWSDETYRIFGLPAGTPVSLARVQKCIHPEDRDRVVDQRLKTNRDDALYDIHYRVLWASGEERYVYSRARRHVDPWGNPSRLTGTVLDVTEQRRTHEAFRASEARFHAFMENSPALAFIKDRDGKMVYMNRVCQTMWNLDRVDWQGKTDAELWSPELAREFRTTDLAVIDQGTGQRNIDVVPLPDGRICNLLTYKFPLQLHNGERLVAGISLDISEQKEAERMALNALADREVLLQEVHHRVKNNLQVICSLLGMQADSLEDEKSIAALREGQNRVQSMATIHELLYGSKTLGDINFTEYVERLATELELSYGLGSRVQFRIEVAPVRFSLDQAIPCGLILNELISNSLKYAFPADREGEIIVSLAALDSQELILAVQDNGVGLPAGFRMDNAPSLGLRIVKILTTQLSGQLRVPATTGTRFEILFPAAEGAVLAAPRREVPATGEPVLALRE